MEKKFYNKQIRDNMYINIINTGRMFVIREEGLESYLAFRIRGQEIDLFNAYVPEVHRGRGYAARLILHSIHFAVLHGLRIRANCPAAEAYIKRNPEWSYILSECVNA
jgi:predicted GNAT family acetyltransferase